MSSLPQDLCRIAGPLLIQALKSDPTPSQLVKGASNLGSQGVRLCAIFFVDAQPSLEPQKIKGCWVQSGSGIYIVSPHNIAFFHFLGPIPNR